MLLAASCIKGIILVVVPLVLLLGDIIKRYEQLGIACTKWKIDCTLGSMSIIFIILKSALIKYFLDYIKVLQVTVRLDKVIINKCYTILEGMPAFQPRL